MREAAGEFSAVCASEDLWNGESRRKNEIDDVDVALWRKPERQARKDCIHGIIINVVKEAVQQNKIKSFGGNVFVRGDVRNEKVPLEFLSGALNVAGIDVHTEIASVGEQSGVGPWAAADIEDPSNGAQIIFSQDGSEFCLCKRRLPGGIDGSAFEERVQKPHRWGKTPGKRTVKQWGFRIFIWMERNSQPNR